MVNTRRPMNTNTSACIYSETTLLFRKTEVCAIDPRVEITGVPIGADSAAAIYRQCEYVMIIFVGINDKEVQIYNLVIFDRIPFMCCHITSHDTGLTSD